MLRRDDELRLSEEVQARYSLDDSCSWKLKVTEDVQRQVVKEAGFEHDVKGGLELLRSATALFPDDKELRQAAHYLRNNIVAPCPVAIGDAVPDVLLYDSQTGIPIQLLDACGGLTDTPTVLFASSYT